MTDRESRMFGDFVFDEENHLYFVKSGEERLEIPSVTKILKKVGLYDYRKGEAAVRRMRFGTHVHKMTEFLDKGDDEALALTCQTDAIPLVEGWERFKKEKGFTIERIEEKFYHPDYWFAGTIDRIGRIANETVLVDIKTGMIHPANKIQTAAYAILVEHAQIHVDRAMCVYLRENNYETLEVPSISEGWEVFKATLKVYAWMNANLGYKIVRQEA